jgi:hypothetical protein
MAVKALKENSKTYYSYRPGEAGENLIFFLRDMKEN